MPFHLSTFRCGTPPRQGEGLRIGVTRRPPRGIPEEKWQAKDCFDVWFPLLAPSANLLKQYRPVSAETYSRFCSAYQHEVKSKADSSRALDLLAAMAARMPVSIGCFCEDENLCHRTHLRSLIEARAKELGLL